MSLARVGKLCSWAMLLLLAVSVRPARAQMQITAPPTQLKTIDLDAMLSQNPQAPPGLTPIQPTQFTQPSIEPTVTLPTAAPASSRTVVPAGMNDPSVVCPDPSGMPACPEPLWQPGAMYGAATPGPFGTVVPPPTYCVDTGERQWQLLPDGLIYKSYLAGVKEPRFAGVWAHDKNLGSFLDVSLGGRAGILRYGNHATIFPQGWQLDIEGAAFPRINLTERWDLDSVDFRFGVPLTYGIGRFQAKFAGYHLSAHVGDEYLVRNPTFQRINYSRDVLVLGASYYPTDNVRFYAETGWAYQSDGGSEPWEFQFGIDYSPLGPTGILGCPFAAINAHLREEVDYGGEFVVQLGWQWRGVGNTHLFRTGFQYFNGKSNQYEFYTRSEQQYGFGIWYDY